MAMTFYILCRDMRDWQIVESLHKSIEGAKRRAQEIVNGEYAEYFEDEPESAYLPPTTEWHKPVDFPNGMLYGKAYTRYFAVEFILREFEMKD